jgi:hypothetical protein
MAFGRGARRSVASAVSGAAVSSLVSGEALMRAWVWSRVLAIALGLGALAGAAQLGVAYGLGLLRLAREVPTDGLWSAQMTWVAWFGALAALGGAAGGAWAMKRYGLVPQLGSRMAVAFAAGLGAAIVVPLTALPADRAVLAGQPVASPVLEAALAAGFGVVLGIIAAVTALSVRLVALSVTLLVAVVWLLALVSVGPSLGPTADLPEVRLGVLDLPAIGGARSTVAVLTPPVLALLVCGVIAGAARFLFLPPLQTAISSTAAPGLLALVYVIGSPGTGDRAVQTSPYAGALIAVAAGLLVSLLVGAVRLPAPRRADGDEDGDGDGDATGLIPPVPAKPFTPAERTEPAEHAEPPEHAEPAAPSLLEPPAWATFSESLTEPSKDTESPTATQPATELTEPSPAFEPPAWPAPPAPPAPPEPPQPAEPPKPTEPPAFTDPPPWVTRTEPPTLEPPTEATPAEPAEPVSPAPVAAAPAPPAPSKRRILPRLKPARKPKEPKEPKEPKKSRKSKEPKPAEPPPVEAAAEVPAPPDTPPAAAPAAAESPGSPGAATRTRRGRREEEHLDWISSLSGQPEAEDESATSRRRLRRDPDLSVPTESPTER